MIAEAALVTKRPPQLKKHLSKLYPKTDEVIITASTDDLTSRSTHECAIYLRVRYPCRHAFSPI